MAVISYLCDIDLLSLSMSKLIVKQMNCMLQGNYVKRLLDFSVINTNVQYLFLLSQS